MKHLMWLSVIFVMMSLLFACGIESALDDSNSSLAEITPFDPIILADQNTPVLPNWATSEEIAGSPRTLLSPRDATPPPTGNFRTPAEYEPMKAVVITWAGYSTMLTDIAGYVASAGAEVWSIGGPSHMQNVPDELFVPLSYSYNTVWVRDYGPIGVELEDGNLGIVDTTYRHYAYRREDDAIPCQLAQTNNVDCFSTSLILDGGNLLVDRYSNLFMTTRTYYWNSHLSESEVDQKLRDYFGVSDIHTFEYAQSYSSPADGTGHLDMFVKLLNDCVVLIAETDNEPFSSTVEKAADYFSELECPLGGSYEIHRIPSWSDYGTWYTYTNSLIVNNVVMVPWYSGGPNEEAEMIYQNAMPEHTIAMIPSDSSIGSGGSIHCVTKEIPLVDGEIDENQAPEAEAGDDISANIDDEVELDGSQSQDPNDDTLSFEWTQIDGPEVELQNADTPYPSFIAPWVETNTELVFELIVADHEFDSESDIVTVLILVNNQNDSIEISATDTPIDIPDGTAEEVFSIIQVDNAGDIASLKVTVEIAHTYRGDLMVKLICPSQQEVTLHEPKLGESSNDIREVYDVSACNNQSFQGEWKLVVSDNYSHDLGVLEAFGLKIN